MLKRFFDIGFSILLLIALCPILLLISLVIFCSRNGPIFFVQMRLGLDCKVFPIIKFRTMVEGAEQMEEGIFNYKKDRRVTRVGSFLRKTSLDELPQLINILRGEMSFVGPRPPLTYELGEIANFPPEVKARFLVKPGVTGLSQVSGRNELSWAKKIQFDNKYLSLYKTYGLLVDFYILLLTMYKIIRMDGSYENPDNSDEDRKLFQK